MKLIIKIARNELRNLFYSPVAWFTIIVFFVMFAWFYTGILYPVVKGYEWNEKTNGFNMDIIRRYWPFQITFTSIIYSNTIGGVLQYLYLYVPLLTMGIISREFSNGTVKLLYTSPVKLRQIVLGKYLAVMVFNLIYILIIGIFMLQGFADLRALDYGQILSAGLGIYLLLCAFTAIGFYMSSLTSYPIVSAIASFAILFILSKIGMLWQDREFVKDITWFLSINNRIEWMREGLIRSKDIVYYLVIIYMFTGFTLLKMSAARETRPWYIRTGQYVIIALSGLLIGYLGARPRLAAYLDTTYRKTNTILPVTQNILKQLDDDLEVTVYTNLFKMGTGMEIAPAGQNAFLDMWEPYIRFKPGIRFKYVYYYHLMPGDSAIFKTFPGKSQRQIAGLLAKAGQLDSTLFKSPEEIDKMIDLEPEGYNAVMQLKYKGRTAFLRVFPRIGVDFAEKSTEPQFNAAFKRLLGTRMPKLAYVTGELERSIRKMGEREYGAQTDLANLGFDLDTLNLAKQDITPEISTLVLADPKMDLNPVVLSKLKDYLHNGGNMLILGEPKKQYVLNPLLRQLGIQLMPGQLVQPNPNETPDKVNGYETPLAFNLTNESWLRFTREAWAYKKAYYEDMSTIRVNGTTALASAGDSGFTVTPLLITRPWDKPAPKLAVWLKTGKLVTDSAAPVFTPQEGDLKQESFASVLQLTRQLTGKEQRILVCGDADFISNIAIGGPCMHFYSWLNYNQFPIFTEIKHSDNNMALIGTRRASMEKIAYVWIAPGILLLLGTVLLVRRARK